MNFTADLGLFFGELRSIDYVTTTRIIDTSATSFAMHTHGEPCVVTVSFCRDGGV